MADRSAHVWWGPTRRGGRVCIAGTGLPLSLLCEWLVTYPAAGHDHPRDAYPHVEEDAWALAQALLDEGWTPPASPHS